MPEMHPRPADKSTGPVPTFVDVQRHRIRARTVAREGVPVLAVEEIHEDDSVSTLLILNKYDAKQLSAACELYLQEIFSAQFAGVDTNLSPDDMLALFGNNDR